MFGSSAEEEVERSLRGEHTMCVREILYPVRDNLNLFLFPLKSLVVCLQGVVCAVGFSIGNQWSLA